MKKYVPIIVVLVLVSSFVLGGCATANIENTGVTSRNSGEAQMQELKDVDKEKVQAYMNSLADLYNSEMEIMIGFGTFHTEDPEVVKKVEDLFIRSQKVYNDFQGIEPPSEEFRPAHERLAEAISAYANIVANTYDLFVNDTFGQNIDEWVRIHHEARKDFRVQIQPLLEKYSANFPIDESLEQQLK
ncbi:hypothetical protein [Brevibacillus reuszeri]|uniref:hypothetical protein n=1 Tax=Brevibacillus reuszeri TaxID=54915 RepID=UPI0028999B5B|nr:hypothetical protein [Brevibacillus reuszeri]